MKLKAGMSGQAWGRVEGRNGDRCDHISLCIRRITWISVLSSSHIKSLACVAPSPPSKFIPSAHFPARCLELPPVLGNTSILLLYLTLLLSKFQHVPCWDSLLLVSEVSSSRSSSLTLPLAPSHCISNCPREFSSALFSTCTPLSISTHPVFSHCL